MTKKAACMLLALFMSLVLSGCWSYHGLNEMTLVSGIAVDKVGERYHLTFETIDLNATTKESAVKAKLIESDGDSVFEAVRNAKKRISNRLYFGNAQLLVLSKKIAEEDGLESLINWFLRDAEIRETAEVVISQEETAKKLLAQGDGEDLAISYEIVRIIEQDDTLVGSTVRMPLYQIYNKLSAQGDSLVLPVFHLADNDQTKKEEANGAAIFKKDKLVGFMSAAEAKYYLMLVNYLNGGILTGEPGEGSLQDVSLELIKNETKVTHSYQNGKLTMNIGIKMSAYLGEYPENFSPLGNQHLTRVQNDTKNLIQEQAKKLIKRVQTEYDSDIFGFGNSIYKTDLPLWEKLKGNWDEIFQTLDVEVDPELQILNTALLR
ncbi:Spore germination protein GerKC [Ruminococcaceae bacterium BL-6]|nr:Spore germination protein GerKC [Ruminococcaceae bacterium BL-6]